MDNKIWQERKFTPSNEEKKGDVRSEWERDYARLIHSSAFRRLQAKTQVLGLGESDFYRTRLTHSMEVAQIGIGILKFLQEKYSTNNEIKCALPTSALMGSICLAHDIGHPPFGHGGEVALNICMRGFGGFEGNGQTLRILSKLDKYTASNGMNPTRRLLLGVLKYPVNYSKLLVPDAYEELRQPKWLSKASKQHPPKCYLDDEEDLVNNWVLKPFASDERESFLAFEKDPKTGHMKTKFHSLDTSIMELADDISYSLHDFEDAISLGMITLLDWKKHNRGFEYKFNNCDINFETLTDNLFGEESYKRKNAIGSLVNALITNTYVKDAGVPNAVSPLIKWNAYLEENHEVMREHIFKLVKQKVIKSTNVQQLELKGQKIVIELFEALDSDPTRLLPSVTKLRYESASSPTEQKRVICDYVSGMTDDYAARLYEKIYYPHKGSIFDRL